MPYNLEKPSLILISGRSDLFHDDVPFDFIQKVLKITQDNHIHTFQVLTRHPGRMIEFFTWLGCPDVAKAYPNLWAGVCVKDQPTANERVPLLLQAQAAVHFLYCEPLLGPVQLKGEWFSPLRRDLPMPGDMIERAGDDFLIHQLQPVHGIHWVVAGGDSRADAGPSLPDWFRSIRDQCAAADIAFFFSNWGSWIPSNMFRTNKKKVGRLLDGRMHDEFPCSYISDLDRAESIALGAFTE